MFLLYIFICPPHKFLQVKGNLIALHFLLCYSVCYCVGRFPLIRVVSEPRLSTSLGSPGETRLLLLRPKARCVRGRLLGYPTSVVEEVDDEFISVRENLIT